MKEDYLWDKIGADAEISALENNLSRLRHRPQRAALLAAIHQTANAQNSSPTRAQRKFVRKFLTSLFADFRPSPALLAFATMLLLFSVGAIFYLFDATRNENLTTLSTAENLPIRESDIQFNSLPSDAGKISSVNSQAISDAARQIKKVPLRRSLSIEKTSRGTVAAQQQNAAPAERQNNSLITASNLNDERAATLSDAEAAQAREDLFVALRLAGDSLRTTQEVVREQRLILRLSGN